jgi:hypothetical protein
VIRNKINRNGRNKNNYTIALTAIKTVTQANHLKPPNQKQKEEQPQT